MALLHSRVISRSFLRLRVERRSWQNFSRINDFSLEIRGRNNSRTISRLKDLSSRIIVAIKKKKENSLEYYFENVSAMYFEQQDNLSAITPFTYS